MKRFNLCRHCRKPVPYQGMGKPRLYCDPECERIYRKLKRRWMVK